MSIRQNLIRLGSNRPDLREDIQYVLNHLPVSKLSSSNRAFKREVERALSDEVQAFRSNTGKNLDPEVTMHPYPGSDREDVQVVRIRAELDGSTIKAALYPSKGRKGYDLHIESGQVDPLDYPSRKMEMTIEEIAEEFMTFARTYV